MDKNKSMSVTIRDDELVTVTKAGEQTKVTYVKNKNTVARTRKLNKDCYCDKDGIVHEYKHTENRQQSPKSVRKTLNKLCDIINANTTDLSRCRWVTLTYADNMTDLSKLRADWGNFCKKAHRKWGDFEYIKVIEPQVRGAWHLHVIMIFEGTAPYIANNDLRKMWGNGYVKAKKMTGGVDFGLYFTASLSDIPLDEAKKAGIEVDNSKISANKKYVKGARLELYPSNMRIFDRSNGVELPKKETMTKAQADKCVKDMRKVSQYTTFPKDSAGHIVNMITIEKYKKE